MRRKPPWNHNIHFHPVVLDAVPTGARRALDVGCGAGGLARELAERVLPGVEYRRRVLWRYTLVWHKPSA